MFILNPYRFGNPLLLDTYSGAAAAYSLRKLRTAYTGSAVRVRRSTDSVEQDVGFDANGNLDENTLQTFCGENLLQYSEQFDNAYWGKSNLTLTANSTTAPDGNSTADKFIETTANSTHGFYYYPFVASANTNYTFSLYLKSSERQYAGLQIAYSGEISPIKRYTILIDLSNGSLIAERTKDGGSGIYSIASIGNGWYRISLNITTSNVSGYQTYFTGFLSNTSTPTYDSQDLPTYTGDSSKGLFVWGAQVNTGSLKPYVQTTTAARDGMGYVTKWYDQSGNARDAAQTTAANQPRIVNAGVVEKVNGKAACYFDGTNDWITLSSYISLTNQSYFVAFTPSATITKSSLQTFFSSDNGVSNGEVYFGNWTNNISSEVVSWVVYTGSSNMTYNTENISNNNLMTFIYSNSPNTYIYKNGSPLTLSVYNSPFTGALYPSNFKSIASISGTSDCYSGYINEFILYPSDQSSSRTSIESNINTYYNIYTP